MWCRSRKILVNKFDGEKSGDFMKAVYIGKKIVTIKLTDSIISRRYCGIRSIYNYGEVPEDTKYVFDDKETVFEKLIEKLGYIPEYKGEKTLFKKREYINEYGFKGRIYKDKLISFEILYTYTVIDNPRIEWLKEDLGFKGYSELIFNREQELKSMMSLNKN